MSAIDDVLPRPRSVAVGEDRVDLRDLTAIGYEDHPEALAGANRLTDLLAAELDLEVPNGLDEPTGFGLRVQLVDAIEDADSEEAYRLSIDTDRVVIEATTRAGIHYAGQTLAQLARLEDGALRVPTGEVTDCPGSEWRGFMADPARGFIPLEALKTLVDRLARAKLNVLHLHLVDSQSWRLELESYPDLAGGVTPEYEGTYSRAEMEELVAYAADRDVQVVPEIDVPGHGLRLLERFPELRCETGEAERAFSRKSAICVGQDRTYEFLEDVFAEVCEIFPSPLIHVGADEWSHHGAEWAECQRCQARMNEQGHDGVYDLYYEFLRRAHEILADHDRRMMVWNDQINISESPDLPKDILVHFWLISHEPWGPPQEGNSLQAFLEQGYEAVNSRTSATYANVLDTDELPTWDPYKLPVVDPEYHDQILGSEMPAWHGWRGEYWTRYYRQKLPSELAVYGDRVWNGSAIEDADGFSRAVTRHVLGPATPAGFDLFDAFGDVLLPTGGPGTDWVDIRGLLMDRSVADATEHCEAARETLAALDAAEIPPAEDVLEAYDDVLVWLLDSLEREGRGVSHKVESLEELETGRRDSARGHE